MQQQMKVVKMEIGGNREIVFQMGWLAKQAHASVVVKCEGTVVLVSAVYGKVSEDLQVVEQTAPLLVEYREKYYAAGKFPGGFIKRELRPSNREILVCRLIDRAIRPSLAPNLANEVQISCIVLSADKYNDPDVLAMNAASIACLLAGLPLREPVGSVRVIRAENNFIAFPTYQQTQHADLEIIVSGTREGVVMLEAGANQVPEDVVLNAIEFAHPYIKQIIDLQQKVIKMCGSYASRDDLIFVEPSEQIYLKIKQKYVEKIKEALFINDRHGFARAMEQITKIAVDEFSQVESEKETLPIELQVNLAINKVKKEIVRELCLNGIRCDGRGLDEMRKISILTDVLPMPHGSALFSRGATQALVSVTLGSKEDQQIVDGILEKYGQRFMLHYNHLPFATGETAFIRGPGRREIGHGALAERAIYPLLPSEQELPHAIRVVSDILESNGSTSMASVCGATLALLDAGVKLKAHAAGISIGLIKESDQRYCLLTDIMGEEDFCGDMDFKIAGTENGITSMQLDIKTDYLTREIIQKALEQAKKARLEIINQMKKVMPEARPDLRPHAPKIVTMPLPPDKVGLVIGQGGRTIKEIENKTGCRIHIDDNNVAYLCHTDVQKLRDAASWINIILEDLKIGQEYRVMVTALRPYGANVEVVPSGHQGMIHISEVANKYVEKIEDFLKPGQVVNVVLKDVDEFGRYRFSIRKLGMRPEEILAQSRISGAGKKVRKKSRRPSKFRQISKPPGKDYRRLP